MEFFKKNKEMFNLNLFDIKLETNTIGRNFIYLDEIDSTNSFLLDKNNKIYEDGTVVFAEKQTKGRGRMNRIWYSEPGKNLNFSILITNKYFFGKNLNLLNLGVSLAAANSIERLSLLHTNVKWPNDILINNKKTAGILLEANSHGSKIERLVIGIGINVNQTSFKGDFNYPPTSIKLECKENIEREKLLAEILNNFEEMLLKIISKPESVSVDWRNKCDMFGKRITVKQENKLLTGIFEDIDDSGYLILRTQKRKEKIHFGDVRIA